MGVKVSVLIWQDVSVRNKIEVLPAVFILQFNVVVTQPVFSSDLVRTWEMVDLLVLVQPLV